MNTIRTALRKALLVILILAVGLLAFPLTGVRAAAPGDANVPPTSLPDPTRLERVWAREQQTFERQGDRLDRTANLITRVQNLIDKANSKGWDTSAVQAALDAFQSAVQNAKSVHSGGTSIIANHTGFDASGKVTDRTQAIATAKALQQVLKDTRAAMDGTGRALLQALKDLRAAHKPTPTATP